MYDARVIKMMLVMMMMMMTIKTKRKLFVVEATALKQQISEFNAQIQCTEASYESHF